jgi:mono/diheme cytochrome c family protein
MATPHGDGVWLFGLNGKKGPAKAPGTGTGTQHAGETPGGATAAATIKAGQAVWSDNCAGCHGVSGHGGNGGPDLRSFPNAKQLAVVTKQVTNGGGGMPPFKGSLTAQQIKAVSTYVTKKITNNNK